MKMKMSLMAAVIFSAVFVGAANAEMIYFCGAPSVSSENGVSKLEFPVYQGPPIGSDVKTPPVIVGLWGTWASQAYFNNKALSVYFNDTNYHITNIQLTTKTCPKK